MCAAYTGTIVSSRGTSLVVSADEDPIYNVNERMGAAQGRWLACFMWHADKPVVQGARSSGLKLNTRPHSDLGL